MIFVKGGSTEWNAPLHKQMQGHFAFKLTTNVGRSPHASLATCVIWPGEKIGKVMTVIRLFFLVMLSAGNSQNVLLR